MATSTIHYKCQWDNKLDYKSHQLIELVEKLKQLIDDQEKEIEEAVMQRGKYRFTPEYKYLEVPEDHWYKMTPQQQQKHLDALHTPRFKVLEECPLCTHHLRIYHFQSMYMKWLIKLISYFLAFKISGIKQVNFCLQLEV